MASAGDVPSEWPGNSGVLGQALHPGVSRNGLASEALRPCERAGDPGGIGAVRGGVK